MKTSHIDRHSRSPEALQALTTFAMACACLLYILPASAEEATPIPSALGAPRSINVVPSMGALSEAIEIEVSPGRRNAVPKLVLTYSSLGGNGQLGVGWQLGVGHVERWRGDGTAAVKDSDTFSYVLSGAGGQLVDTGSGVYRARTESIYREFRRTESGGWMMFNGEAVAHYFGSSADTRLEGQLWLLDSVVDANGNSVDYDYTNVDGAFYLERIRYAGYAPNQEPGPNQVDFQYEERMDIRKAYRGYAYELKHLRLKSINVSAAGQPTRRYEFEYQPNPLNGQSMLSQIILVGADGSSTIPIRSFEYGTRDKGWLGDAVEGSVPTDLADAEGNDTGARTLDVNGDGFADLVGGPDRKVELGDGEGGFAEDSSWSQAFAAIEVDFVDDEGLDAGVRLLDVDSDAFADIFIAAPGRREVWINDGTQWLLDAQWTAALAELNGPVFTDPWFGSPEADTCTQPHCDGQWGYFDGCTPPHCTGEEGEPDGCVPPECMEGETDGCLPPECSHAPEYAEEDAAPLTIVGDQNDWMGVQFSDVNGDGRVDVLWSMSSSEGLYYLSDRVPVEVRAVYLNTGEGWERHPGLSSALTPFEFVTDSQINGYEFMDVNGDGLADVVRSRTGEGYQQEVYLGTGHGWALDAEFSQSLVDNGIISLDEQSLGQGLVPADYNDDGLLDFLQSSTVSTRAFRNTGTGWEPDPEMTQLLIDDAVTFVTHEFNDDTDRTEARSTGTILTGVNGDGIADILSAKAGSSRILMSRGIRSGLMLEAKTAIGEVTSIEWAMSNTFDNRNESGVEQLPINIPVVAAIVRENGRGNQQRLEYVYGGGLYDQRQLRGFAWAELHKENGVVATTVHDQTEALAGHVLEESAYASTGELLTRRSLLYEVVDSTPLIRQVRLASTKEELHEQSETTSSLTTYAYDARLAMVSVYKDPDSSLPGDETTTEFEWVVDEPAGFWSMPFRTTTYDSQSEIVAGQIYYYDGLSLGTATKGLPSESREWIEADRYTSMSLQYDKYGNVIAITDRAGGTSHFEYDSTATFRVSATDPDGRIVASEKDPRFGVTLLDVDPSGNATAREFDSFGRLVKITLPGDEAAPGGTRSYTYSPLGDANGQHYSLHETQSPGESETIDSSTNYDGYGQVYRAERKGSENRTIVSFTEFDDEGNPALVSQPHFEGDPPLASTIERDELSRPIRTVDPDGYEFNTTYVGRRADVSGRGGITTSYWRNVAGDVTKILKTVNGEEQETRYSYDVLGRMTSVTDALGEVTRVSYDGLGRRTMLDDPNTGTYHYLYDGEGRLIEQMGPADESIRFDYSIAGDLQKKIFPDGSEVRFNYGVTGDANAVGLVREVVDAAGRVEIFYDVRGNVIERRRELSAMGSKKRRAYLTGYDYDSIGRLRRLTYPDGFIVDYHYSSSGSLEGLTDGHGKVIADGLDYTAAGQLEEIVFGNGAQSRFSYNEMSRMTSIFTSTAGGRELQNLDYYYDPDGNILAIEDLAFGHSQAFQYDDGGRLVEATGRYGDRTYEYDAIGNLTRKANMVFSIDPEHPQRVTRALYTASGNTPPSQDAVAPVSAGKRQRSRNRAARSAASTTSPLAGKQQKVKSFDMRYDERGNVIRKGTTRFDYDAENNLVRVRASSGRLLEQNFYDAQGERVVQISNASEKSKKKSKTIFIDGVYEESADHVSHHVYAPPLLVSTILAPKRTRRLITEIERDFIGLTQPGMGHGLEALAYQHLASLIFIPLALLLIGGIRLVPIELVRRLLREIAVTATAMRANPAGSFMALWVLPVFLMVSSTPVSARPVDTRSSPATLERLYYHSNHLGSVNIVTKQNGRIVSERYYTPYGDPADWSGPKSGPRETLLTFGGHRYDDQVGLYYFGARHYDPQLGRFMSPDTQVPDPMDPRTLNRYAFAGGNPIRYADPTGHAWWDVILGIAVFIVGIAIGVALTIATLGWGSEIGVIVGIAIGAVGFVLIAAGIGAITMGVVAAVSGLLPFGPTAGGFWKSVLTGVLLGAVVGAGLVSLVGTFFGAGPAVLGMIGSAILIGGAMGALEETATHFANGGGPDDLLGSMLKAAGISAGISLGALAVGGLALGGGYALGIVSAVKEIAGKLAMSPFVKVALKVLKPLWSVVKYGYKIASTAFYGGRIVHAAVTGTRASAALASLVYQAANNFQFFAIMAAGMAIGVLRDFVHGGVELAGTRSRSRVGWSLETMPLRP